MTSSNGRTRRSAAVLFTVAGGLIIGTAGCTPWQYARRTLYSEMHHFPRVTEGRSSVRQYTRWAKQEWRSYATSTESSHSSDYVSGFIHGFTSFVYAGGSTDPPPVPPSRYWRIGFRNNRGDQAVRDWYHGYKHGANTAREKGYRERAVVPSSMLLGYNQKQVAQWERDFAESRSSSSTPTRSDALTDPFVDDPIGPTPADAEPGITGRDAESIVAPSTPELVPKPDDPLPQTAPLERMPEVAPSDDVFDDLPESNPTGAPPVSDQTDSEAVFEIGEHPPAPPWPERAESRLPPRQENGSTISKIASEQLSEPEPDAAIQPASFDTGANFEDNLVDEPTADEESLNVNEWQPQR